MGKKKFIDKKKSATFHLMARDSSDPKYSADPSGDRVLVRVDNNGYTPLEFLSEGDPDPDSIFEDAPEDCDDVGINVEGVSNHNAQTSALPDHIRREILELGFPDDGYNYLNHLQEIYYHKPKANFGQLSRDVKAYDASRVEVSKISDASDDKPLFSVASKTVGVRLQKVVDPEVAAMLDNSASSDGGSDIEELEEDFVVRANLMEGSIGDELDEKLPLATDSEVDHVLSSDFSASGETQKGACVSDLASEKSRARRPLDEHFDLLELQEYGSDSEEEYNGYTDEDEPCLTEKLNHAFKDHPPNLLHLDVAEDDNEPPELTAEVIRKCKEYADKYEDEDHDVEEVLVEESSDESQVWDCETIISTYSTFDNHPGKIGAPEARRKKKLSDTLSGASAGPNQVITLKGKEMLPVDFLPRVRKNGEEKIKDESDKRTEVQKRKPRGQESKEEKKERKSAVKSERREARQMKKETKELYKFEAQRAQKVAAFTGPTSIHLM